MTGHVQVSPPVGKHLKYNTMTVHENNNTPQKTGLDTLAL